MADHTNNTLNNLVKSRLTYGLLSKAGFPLIAVFEFGQPPLNLGFMFGILSLLFRGDLDVRYPEPDC